MYFSDEDLEVGKKELERLRSNYTATLAWANKVREEKFSMPPLEDLPMGERGCSVGCVVHNCFAALYDGSIRASDYRVTRAGVFGGEVNVEVSRYPKQVLQFVADFDYGKYPELELTE